MRKFIIIIIILGLANFACYKAVQNGTKITEMKELQTNEIAETQKEDRDIAENVTTNEIPVGAKITEIMTNTEQENTQESKVEEQDIKQEIIENKAQEQTVTETKQDKPTEKKTTKGSTNNQKQESKQVLSSASKSEDTKTQEIVQAEEKIETQEIIQETKITTAPKQEEKIYCVDGGSVHILGDGANEHGYYKTWDEAFKDYEDYTEGWESTQFRVDQCYCGLYYFWAIK